MNFTQKSPERSHNEAVPDPRIQAINERIIKIDTEIAILSKTKRESSLGLIQEVQKEKDKLTETKLKLIEENNNSEESFETDANRMIRLAQQFDIHGVSTTTPGVINLKANGFDRFNNRRSA